MNKIVLSGAGKTLFNNIEFDKEEQLLAEIRKHPVGEFFIFFIGSVFIIILSIIFFIMPSVLDGEGLSTVGVNQSTVALIAAMLGLLIVGGTIVVTIIRAYLYKSNVMLVTSEKVAQVLNPTLFKRKISQLSIGDVQDVTIKQDGFLPRFFNYGTIVIETAGEQENYTYSFAPDPYGKSKIIVGAHEENLKLYGN